MSSSGATATPSLRPPAGLQRILGRAGGVRPGPTLLVTGGLHGNEPAGVHAALRVIGDLQQSGAALEGRLLCLAGNLRALEEGCRYVDEDLNRLWTPERVARLRERNPTEDPAPSVEEGQMGEILGEIEGALDESRGQVFFLDLHTCSAAGTPFLTLGDALRNRRFAWGIPLPVVLGLEERVDGSLLEYLNNRGIVTLGAEGGQHQDPSSVDHLASVLWFGLVSAGLLRESQVPDLRVHRRRLRQAASNMPRVVEVRYRHPTTPGDGFRMEPGFANIHPVWQGQLLARDQKHAYHAQEDGLVLLPRYQGQGNDGYFLAREVRPFWLGLSALLRRLRVGRLAHLLPGIRKHPDRPGTLVVDLRVARFYPMEVFHLLGYRKVRREEDRLLVTRRVFDLAGPGGNGVRHQRSS